MKLQGSRSGNIPEMHSQFVLSGFTSDLENEFFNDIFNNTLGLIRFTLIMSTMLVASFGILDIWILPSGKYIAWIIRFAVICPYLLICFSLSFFKYFKKIEYPALCSGVFITAVGISIMIAIANKEKEPAYSLYFVGLILVSIALNTGGYVRFNYAFITNILILITYEIVAIFFNNMFSSPESIAVFINNNFFLISSQILGMIACFFIEYYLRQTFLLKKRIRLEEKHNKLKAIDNWKEAYRIYKQIDSELLLNNIKNLLNGGTVEEYIKKIKKEQVSSGILSLIRNITSNNDISTMFSKIMDMSMEMSNAERGCVVMKNEQTSEPVVITSKNVDISLMDFLLSIMKDIMDSGQIIMLNNLRKNENITQRIEVNKYGIQSLLCFPIDINEKIIGAYYLDSTVSDSIFTEENCEMIMFLITQVAISLGIPPWHNNSKEIVIDELHFNAECEKFNLRKSEKDVLLLVIKGFSNKEISDKSFISMNTLRSHLKSIYNKTGVNDREKLFNQFARYWID